MALFFPLAAFLFLGHWPPALVRNPRADLAPGPQSRNSVRPLWRGVGPEQGARSPNIREDALGQSQRREDPTVVCYNPLETSLHREDIMPTQKKAGSPVQAAPDLTPLVAATLTGVIYQARLMNRQMKVNIPENELIPEIVGLWRSLTEELEATRS